MNNQRKEIKNKNPAHLKHHFSQLLTRNKIPNTHVQLQVPYQPPGETCPFQSFVITCPLQLMMTKIHKQIIMVVSWTFFDRRFERFGKQYTVKCQLIL